MSANEKLINGCVLLPHEIGAVVEKLREYHAICARLDEMDKANKAPTKADRDEWTEAGLAVVEAADRMLYHAVRSDTHYALVTIASVVPLYTSDTPKEPNND